MTVKVFLGVRRRLTLSAVNASRVICFYILVICENSVEGDDITSHENDIVTTY